MITLNEQPNQTAKCNAHTLTRRLEKEQNRRRGNSGLVFYYLFLLAFFALFCLLAAVAAVADQPMPILFVALLFRLPYNNL